MTKPRPSKRKARTWAEVPAKRQHMVLSVLRGESEGWNPRDFLYGKEEVRANRDAFDFAIAELRRAAKVRR